MLLTECLQSVRVSLAVGGGEIPGSDVSCLAVGRQDGGYTQTDVTLYKHEWHQHYVLFKIVDNPDVITSTGIVSK